jgi:hypothetical protein
MKATRAVLGVLAAALGGFAAGYGLAQMDAKAAVGVAEARAEFWRSQATHAEARADGMRRLLAGEPALIPPQNVPTAPLDG